MDKQYRRVSTNGDRPALLRLLNDTQPDDRVLVWKLDRLARNVRLLLEIEAKFRDIQVPLISIQGGERRIGSIVE